MKYAFTIKNSNSPIEEILFLYQLLSSVSLDFFLFAKSMVSSYSTHEKYGQKTCLKNFSCKTCCWLVQILLRNENVLNQSSCLDSWKDCEIENLPHYFFKILSIRLNLYQKCLKSISGKLFRSTLFDKLSNNGGKNGNYKQIRRKTT